MDETQHSIMIHNFTIWATWAWRLLVFYVALSILNEHRKVVRKQRWFKNFKRWFTHVFVRFINAI